MPEFEKIVKQVDSNILEARNKTECEHIERYKQFGFTEEDYRETKAVIDDFFVLWHAPEVAKQRGTKPQLMIAEIILGAIGTRLRFPDFVLRRRDGVKQ